MTIARVQAMYEADRELARQLKQPSAAVSATIGIARLYGMDKDAGKPSDPLQIVVNAEPKPKPHLLEDSA